MRALGYDTLTCCEVANKVAAKVVSLESSKLEKKILIRGLSFMSTLVMKTKNYFSDWTLFEISWLIISTLTMLTLSIVWEIHLWH